MPNISRTKTWASGETLTASDLNAEFNGVLAGINDSALDADNLTLSDAYAWTGLHTFNNANTVFGHTSALTTNAANQLQVLGTADADSSLLVGRFSADASGGQINFAKSRNGTIGEKGAVVDNDVLGGIYFYGCDVTTSGDFATPGASMLARVNGSPGSDDLPTELVFSTTADAGNSTTERLRISQAGLVEVVGDLSVGDDVTLSSDSAVLSMGAGNDVTLTHDGTTGVTIAATPITVDSGGSLTLDAHTGIHIFKDAGTERLRFTEGNSGDVTIKLATDGKDLVFTDNGDATNLKILDAAAGINVPGEVQTTKLAYTDGDDALTIADGGGLTVAQTLGLTKDKLVIGGVAVTTTAAELNILDTATVTATELNLIDGGTARGTTAVASGDGILINDAGTMRMTNVDTVSTYFSSHNVGGSNIATVGTIGTGTWQGTAVASAYLDADTAHLGVVQTFTANKTFTGTVTVGVDDDGKDVKFFGAAAGAYMEYDASEDQLRIMGASADATTSTGKLLLATSLTDVNANDVIGKIDFQAPHETGTDATAIAASIQAVAQGTFSASVNATDLLFLTGHSEAAAEKLRITSQGEIGIGGANYGTDGQVLTSGGAGAAVAWEDATGSGVSLSGSTNNTVATVTGSNALIGEANLLFASTGMAIGNATILDADATFGSAIVRLGGNGFLASQPSAAAGNGLHIAINAHLHGGDWECITDDESARLQMQDGVFRFYTAAAPGTGDGADLSFGAIKMQLDVNGNLGIAMSPGGSHKLDVTGSAGLSTGTAWTNTSDVRIKENVATITGATDKLKRLRPVSYRYTDQYLSVHGEINGALTYHSFIADEYATVFPNAVSTQGDLVRVVPESGNTPEQRTVLLQDLKQYTPHDLPIFLVRAIQELDARIAALE